MANGKMMISVPLEVVACLVYKTMYPSPPDGPAIRWTELPTEQQDRHTRETLAKIQEIMRG